MCFQINSDSREKLVRKFSKSPYLYFYKVINKDNSALIYEYQYKGGWNKAKYDNYRYDNNTRSGIYVCLTKKEAKTWYNPRLGEKIIRVRCHLRDLLYVNDYFTQATFKKCWIDKSELIQTKK